MSSPPKLFTNLLKYMFKRINIENLGININGDLVLITDNFKNERAEPGIRRGWAENQNEGCYICFVILNTETAYSGVDNRLST